MVKHTLALQVLVVPYESCTGTYRIPLSNLQIILHKYAPIIWFKWILSYCYLCSSTPFQCPQNKPTKELNFLYFNFQLVIWQLMMQFCFQISNSKFSKQIVKTVSMQSSYIVKVFYLIITGYMSWHYFPISFSDNFRHSFLI